MKKSLFLLSFLFFQVFVVFSQLEKPVKWSFSTQKISETEIELIFNATIEKKWHLYGQYFPDGGPIRLIFSFEKSKNFDLVGKTLESPKPIEEQDDIFGIKVQFFKDKATFKQKIKRLTDKNFKISAKVEGQACLDDGKCVQLEQDFSFNIEATTFKPQTDSIKNNPIDSAKKKITPDSVKNTKNDSLHSTKNHTSDSSTVKNATKSSATKDESSLLIFFLIAIGTGFAALLTPCVFPMIPMTVSFFMKKEKSKKIARVKAIFYGFSIIFIYTALGTLVTLTLGAEFANFLSTHWFPNVLFFVIFMIFAASFLGMFEITLPSWITTKTDAQASKGGFLAPFFMALTLAIVSFSCTGPLVGSILVASTQGEILKPIIGMFGFSLGIAIPFTLFAFFPEWLKSLKSGSWLNSVKVVLGFIEIALGLKFLSTADQTYHWGILDREIYLAFWIIIAILLGFYLLGKLKFAHDDDLEYISVPRLSFAILTFTFALYMIPGMFGAPLRFLAGYLPPQTTQDFDVQKLIRENSSTNAAKVPSNLCEKPKYTEFLHLPHGLEGYFDYEQALNCARKLKKPLFIDFTGHGCVNCRKMEENVWSHPQVLKRLRENFVIVALYVDDKKELPESDWILSKVDGKKKTSLGKKYADFQIEKYKVNAQPYYVLLDNNENLLAPPRAYDLNVDEFIKFLDQAIEKFR